MRRSLAWLASLGIVGLALATQAAEQRLVVLPLDVTQTGGKMTEQARASIEVMLRGEAANALRGTGWSVMDGATTIRILQDNGIDPAKCGEGSCHLETAKTMNVPKFISGSVQYVEGYYIATFAIYDTKSGDILSSVRIESETIRGLGHDFAKKRDEFFAASGLLRRADRPKEVGGGSEGKIGGGSDELSLGADELVIPFESNPTGAVVVVDGKLICPATPCSRQIGLGLHEVSMQKEGYESSATTLDVKKGAKAMLKLLRATATLSVDTQPRGLSVSIDGKPAGKSPINAEGLNPGAHEVVIDDPCWQRQGERVVLKKGEDRKLQLNGQERLAGLKISAEDKQGNAVEGTAMLDGRELGSVPGSFKIGICGKKLEVKGKGGLGYTAQLKLEEHKVSGVRAVLAQLGPVVGEARVEPKSGLRFIAIPGGTFQYQGTKDIEIKAFELGETATTVEAYARCVQAGACSEPKTAQYCNWGTDRADHPINCVDWNQAVAFCKWIGARLPTEEEREYVASGGSEARTYPWGNEEPGARACWDGEGSDLGKGNRKSTCPVGSHKAADSKWGVHDLAGNVWDWTISDYDAGNKVIRGGSWNFDIAEHLRARYRDRVDPSNRNNNIGFRCGLYANALNLGAGGQVEPAAVQPRPPGADANNDDGAAAPEGEEKQAIGERIRRGSQEVISCYDQSLGRNPTLQGKLYAAFHIQADGTVTNIVTEGLDHPELSTCIRTAISKWRFEPPRAGRPLRIKYPFIFVPKQ